MLKVTKAAFAHETAEGAPLPPATSVEFDEARTEVEDGWQRRFTLGDGRLGRLLWDGNFTGEGATDLHISVQLRRDIEEARIPLHFYESLPGFRVDAPTGEDLKVGLTDQSESAKILEAAGLLAGVPQQLTRDQIDLAPATVVV